METIKLIAAGSGDIIEAPIKPYYVTEDWIVCVYAPCGDEWTTTEKFDLKKVGASWIQEGNHNASVVFPNGEARTNFHSWLEKANISAEWGYRNMRG